MIKLFSLNNQYALVTGASGHLGRSMCFALAEAGAIVIVQGRNEAKIKALVNELIEQGFKAYSAVFDLLNPLKTKEYFDDFPFDKLNVLINNAYQGAGGTIETATDEDYENSFNIGLVSAQRIFKYALPFMLKGQNKDSNASCINVASMYGLVSPDKNIYQSAEQTNPPFYGAVKAALIQWSKYAACEFAEKGIRVNSISPGPFPNVAAQHDKEFIQRLEGKIPMNRVAQADEIKGVINFLASNAASYVTGENISIDGGWTAK